MASEEPTVPGPSRQNSGSKRKTYDAQFKSVENQVEKIDGHPRINGHPRIDGHPLRVSKK